MVILTPKNVSHAIEVPRNSLRIPSFVLNEKLFTVFVEVVVWQRPCLRLRFDSIVQFDDGQALDAAEVGGVDDEDRSARSELPRLRDHQEPKSPGLTHQRQMICPVTSIGR
jgi:hypothetical protein